MTSKITINIETDDAELAGRIADAFCGRQPVVNQTREAYAPGVTADDMELIDTRTSDDEQDWSGHNDNGYAENPTVPTEDHEQEETAGNSDVPRDHHGVAFNNHYCGEAQEPFYSSGRRSGQWKKKRGVSDKDYDDWYAEELAELQGAPTNSEPDPEPLNTGAAFGSPQHQQQAAPNVPQDTGSFMGWVAEKQAAGLITQDDIQAAYGQVGCQVADLFPPNDAQAIAGAIGKLHGILAQKAGA